jgi:hypothetical protein
MAYDPKWKKELPFYDVIPLYILMARSGDRCWGINIHYLPWTYRIQLAKKLVQATKNKKRLKYKDIRDAWISAKIPLAYAYMCIRCYLYSHIRSEIIEVNYDNYQKIVQDIHPKFKKEDEMTIIKYIMWKFNTHKKNVKSGVKTSLGWKAYLNRNRKKK